MLLFLELKDQTWVTIMWKVLRIFSKVSFVRNVPNHLGTWSLGTKTDASEGNGPFWKTKCFLREKSTLWTCLLTCDHHRGTGVREASAYTLSTAAEKHSIKSLSSWLGKWAVTYQPIIRKGTQSHVSHHMDGMTTDNKFHEFYVVALCFQVTHARIAVLTDSKIVLGQEKSGNVQTGIWHRATSLSSEKVFSSCIHFRYLE